MLFLCDSLQGAKFAERHSDEISILVTDYDTNQTDALFDYSVQKIVSIAASMATGEFCRLLLIAEQGRRSLANGPRPDFGHLQGMFDKASLAEPHLVLNETFPSFDARAFSLPEHEIVNYFHWRQLDAARNSISMFARAHFSHKQVDGKTGDEKQEMLFQKGVNWGKLPQEQKTGFVCFREMTETKRVVPKGPQAGQTVSVKRAHWAVKPAPGHLAGLKSVIEGIPLRKEKTL